MSLIRATGTTHNRPRQNIGEIQRLVSAIVGITLFALAFRRRSPPNAMLAMTGGSLLYRAMSGYCPAFDVIGLDTADIHHETNRIGRQKVPTARATKIRRAIEIHRPPHELYRYWRAFDNLPRIMRHLDSVQVIDDRLSHWVLKAPGGATLEWDAEIINDVEHERIGWRSLKSADVEHAGSVQFEPSDNGRRTIVTVTMQYVLPGGASGSMIAKVLGEDPDSLMAEDLERFKRSMERPVHSSEGTW